MAKLKALANLHVNLNALKCQDKAKCAPTITGIREICDIHTHPLIVYESENTAHRFEDAEARKQNK